LTLVDPPRIIRRMRPFRAIIVLALLASCARAGAPLPAAHEERPAREAASIDLCDALAAARAYADRKQVDLKRKYVHAAGFDSVTRQWRFTWRPPHAKGAMFITVAESGEIQVILR
jgi:hypothetical protein